MPDIAAEPNICHVVVAVFDGLRPDLVRPELTPNILRLAAKGEWFRQARSVFPSVTRVATTSIATGAPPAAHGIVGNQFYFPEILKDRIFDTSKAADIHAAETALNGNYIKAATFGDQLAKAGKSLAVVHTGSAGSAHSINPRAKANGHWTFSIHGEMATQTPEAVREAIERLGPLPAKELPKLKDQDYAASVMTDIVLPKRQDVSLIWFSEPDTSFHFLEIGSEGSFAALKNADRAFGTILDAIEALPDAEKFAILVASDHGQISTYAALPLFEQANETGFSVGLGDQLAGNAFVATTGSSGEIRGLSASDAEVERMAHWLMEHPDVSHVFSRDKNGVDGMIDGTLSLKALGLDHPRAAELMFILRSDLSHDRYGLPGLGLLMPGDVAPGGGYHGGINPHELNTVLIASSPPHFSSGTVNHRPAGIIDIGPTILDLLGVEKASTMVGKSLAGEPDTEPTIIRLEARSGGFEQQIALMDDDGRRFILHGGQE
jgi:arylsulfatase A-like enzyme